MRNREGASSLWQFGTQEVGLQYYRLRDPVAGWDSHPLKNYTFSRHTDMHSNPPARGDWDRSVAGCRVRIIVCDTARRPGVGDCGAGPCFPFTTVRLSRLWMPQGPSIQAGGTFSGSGCITSQREFNTAWQGAMNDDLNAIRRVLAADVESFRRLVERYQRPLLTLIRNLTPPDTDHEGVGQEVFLAAFRSLASFDPKRSAFSTWLFTIARNRCRNELARLRPVVGALLPDVVDLRSPERAASEAELFRQLDAALAALPFEQRSAFVLAHLQGLSYEEVGRIEGVGVGTVKSRIARAREKLRCLLSHAAEPHS